MRCSGPESAKHRTSLGKSTDVLPQKYGCFHRRSPMFLFSGKCSPFERCLQEPFRKHKHLVRMYIIDKVILRLSDKSAPMAGKFLKFGTVGAGRVRPRWFSLRSNSLVSARRKLIGSGEPDDRGHSLVCVYVGMRFYAVFLLPTLGMPADTIEYEVGEQEYGSRVCSFQTIEPWWNLPFSVRLIIWRFLPWASLNSTDTAPKRK